MRLLNLLALSPFLTLSTSTPTEDVVPVARAGLVPAANPINLNLGAIPGILHASNLDDASSQIIQANIMVTYCTDTLVEIRKHTGLINSTLNFNGPLTSAQRVLCINTVRNEIAAIVQALTQLNWACIGHWGDGIPDLGVARLDTLNAVLALVWEVIFTIRSAMSKLQVSIYQLLGSLVWALLSAYAQLFSILNVWIDGFMKLTLAALNQQIVILRTVFAGLMAYAVDIVGGLLAQITRLLMCLLG